MSSRLLCVLFVSIVAGWTLQQPARSTVLDRTQLPLTPSTRLDLFGGLFGGDTKQNTVDDGTLRVYDNVADAAKSNSLIAYLQEWVALFEKGTLKLTTPADVSVLPNGVRILFRKVDTGYKSAKEEDTEAKQDKGGNNNSNKKKSVKQGGVEIVVEESNERLSVVARRCEMDEDTVIKEMSEETIVNELQKALNVWKKEKVQ